MHPEPNSGQVNKLIKGIMKALQIVKYGELKDSLSINEIEKPSIKASDILIETKAVYVKKNTTALKMS